MLPVRKTHDQAQLLTPKNPLYRDCIFLFTTQQFKQDVGKGDITTDSLFSASEMAIAKIISRQNGILAGLQEIEYFLIKGPRKMRPGLGEFRLKIFKKDGAPVKADEILVEISGIGRDILKVERTILNLLGRMSGIATQTARMAEKIRAINKNILLTPTRKTLWRLLDKRACSLGGGGTHRLRLDDAILIKDNHLNLRGKNIAAALNALFPLRRAVQFVEIEVENKTQALKAALEFKKLQEKRISKVPCFIMLDNFSVAEIQSAVYLLQERGLRKNIGLEISGGITEKNIERYAKTDVDIISMGRLTNGAAMLDLSMESTI